MKNRLEKILEKLGFRKPRIVESPIQELNITTPVQTTEITETDSSESPIQQYSTVNGESKPETTSQKVSIEDKLIPKKSNLPSYNRKRIFGTENEYGIGGSVSFNGLPQWNTNGSLIYQDCGHIEYASPETSNPLDAVIFEKAGELLSQKYSSKLYKNNVDSVGNSFGAHENYYCFIPPNSLADILPFLVTRQIYAGSGKLNPDGTFEISQRASFMENSVGGDTTKNRGIICLKEESLTDESGYRLHLILGDANMCEVADFLKLGTTSLILDLAEDNKLPIINYNSNSAVNDIKNISSKASDWTLDGIQEKDKSGLSIQKQYLEAAKAAYKDRDEITNQLLYLWEDTLEKLEKDQDSLIGRVDWITKKALIDQYAKKYELPAGDPILRNIDLQYHDTDRETGLFYALQNQGKIERITTDEEIEKATTQAPTDTRAHARGRILAYINENKSLSEKFSVRTKMEWQTIYILTKGTDRCRSCGEYHDKEEPYSISDPFNRYENLAKQIIEEAEKKI